MLYSAEDILTLLDEAARSFVFPMLDNGYVYPAASRLSLYRSPEDWAFVFETFGFSPRAWIPAVLVTTIASNLSRTKSETDFATDEAYRTYLQVHSNDEQEFYYPIEDDTWIDPEIGDIVEMTAKCLTPRGNSEPLPTMRGYDEAGVVLECASEPRVFELCRALAHSNRQSVLATVAEREANLPSGVVHLLTLDEWNHPDVADSSILPSGNETFQQLASSLSCGSASVYRPNLQPNSHWSNWPEGGRL